MCPLMSNATEVLYFYIKRKATSRSKAGDCNLQPAAQNRSMDDRSCSSQLVAAGSFMHRESRKHLNSASFYSAHLYIFYSPETFIRCINRVFYIAGNSPSHHHHQIGKRVFCSILQPKSHQSNKLALLKYLLKSPEN